MLPYRKHILLCIHSDCHAAGTDDVRNRLRALIREHDLRDQVLLTLADCLGNCGLGPNLVVYPDGFWYSRVSASDVDELFRASILGNEPLVRLLVHRHVPAPAAVAKAADGG